MINKTMKRIVIIDGGPRKMFNTASMLQKAYDAGRRMAQSIA